MHIAHLFWSLVGGGVCHWGDLAPYHPHPHTLETVSHIVVEQTLEHKDSDALQGVENCEGVGKVDVVDGQVEQAEDPGGAQEEDQQGDPLDIGDQQLDVSGACVELVEDHGVDCIEQKGKVGADDDGRRNDEGEDKVIVNSKPAKV